MDGNSVKGKSGVGTETGAGSEVEVEVLFWISTPSSERIIALLGLCTFFRIFMLPCCIAVEVCILCGLPLSSKKSASSGIAAA